MKKNVVDKNFYKQVFTLIIPIMFQQLFISIAGYVDNLMINSYGNSSLAYNGVSAANRLMFVFNFIWLAFATTASIFISQYYGAKNNEKIKESVRLSLIVEILAGIVSIGIIFLFGQSVVNSYVQDETSRKYGFEYLEIMATGVIFISINCAISNALRSIKKPVAPLIAGASGILVNIVLNYCLIFGNFGFPELGVRGAAIATVASKVMEFLVLVVTLMVIKEQGFKGIMKSLKVSKSLLKDYVKKGIPLVMNELLWSVGMIVLAKFYTYKNDLWYTAYSYSQNVSDLFFIIFAGIGTGTAVIIGESLGQDDFEKAEKNYHNMRVLSVKMGVTVGVLMIILGPIIARLFNSSPEVRSIMIKILFCTGIFCGVYCYNSVSFFTLRSGGDTVRAFILDQTPTYAISIPLAIVLGVNAQKLSLSLPLLFLITHCGDVFKIFLGNYFVKKKNWLKNLTYSKN